MIDLSKRSRGVQSNVSCGEQQKGLPLLLWGGSGGSICEFPVFLKNACCGCAPGVHRGTQESRSRSGSFYQQLNFFQVENDVHFDISLNLTSRFLPFTTSRIDDLFGMVPLYCLVGLII